MSGLQVELDKIDEKILQATRDRIQQMLNLQKKQHGTVSLPDENGIVIKGEVSRTVQWDSNQLMSVASNLPWNVVQQVFDIKFKVPEKAFAKLSTLGLAPEVIQAIDGARTTKYGDLKVTLTLQSAGL
jgi:hypothetical protein